MQVCVKVCMTLAATRLLHHAYMSRHGRATVTLAIFIGRRGEAQIPAPLRALPQPRSAAQVKLAQCTAAGGDTPAAVCLLRPLLAEHEAQFADLFVEIGNFLFDRGEPEEARRPLANPRPGLQHHGDVLRLARVRSQGSVQPARTGTYPSPAQKLCPRGMLAHALCRQYGMTTEVLLLVEGDPENAAPELLPAGPELSHMRSGPCRRCASLSVPVRTRTTTRSRCWSASRSATRSWAEAQTRSACTRPCWMARPLHDLMFVSG